MHLPVGLFTPKKDQCDLCASKKVGNVTDDEFRQHQEKKDAAREAKKQDILESELTDKTVDILVDMQKVLLSSKINASATYYKTKLCNYKYTVYDAKTPQAVCYFWSESTTDLSSNTFGCLIYDYLTSNDKCQVADYVMVVHTKTDTLK